MRFATALSASLALHIAIGFIPQGQLSLATKHGFPLPPGGSAPLWVSLGPNSQSLVLLATSPPPIGPTAPPSRQQAASAPALANTEDIPSVINPRGEAAASKALGGEPGLPKPHYFPQSEVSTPAHMLSGIDGLPKTLARDVDSGRMIVMLYIDEQGTVDKIVVENSELRSDMREVLASQFEHVRFSPAIKDAQPVKSRLRLEITLQPPGPFMPPNRTSAAGN